MSLTLCESCGNINSKLKRKRKNMKLVQKIVDIEFITQDVYGETMEVSKPIVMASAAGWYVGKVCKTDLFNDGSQFIVEPYDRFTDYFATSEEAQVVLDTPIEQGGFNENEGVVEKEFA